MKTYSYSELEKFGLKMPTASCVQIQLIRGRGGTLLLITLREGRYGRNNSSKGCIQSAHTLEPLCHGGLNFELKLFTLKNNTFLPERDMCQLCHVFPMHIINSYFE